MNSDLQIVLWAMGGGFAGTWMMMFYLFSQIHAKFDRIDKQFDQMNARIDKLSEKIEDIDKRLCRIEGGLSSLGTHGHCLFNQSHKEKKVE